MILFTEREKEHTRGMYAELAGSIAEAILDGERVHHERVQAGIESGGATVFVAAYAHRFGTDLSAFASERDAGRALIDIATRQCARDPDIRGSVIERFGRWPAQAMPSRELDQLIEDWGQFAPGEQLWVSHCAVECAAPDRGFHDRGFHDRGFHDRGFHERGVHDQGVHDRGVHGHMVPGSPPPPTNHLSPPEQMMPPDEEHFSDLQNDAFDDSSG